jgi:hypothetical protein
MTPKPPPVIATWLLEHFGCGPNIDTVLGDLAEQYLHNGSAAWYWRQTMKAIPITFFREIRAHKGVAARALLTVGPVDCFRTADLPPSRRSSLMAALHGRYGLRD